MDVSKVLSTITGSKEYDLTQIDAGSYTHCPSLEAAKRGERMFRYHVAQQFLMGCTFDSVHKPCVRSGGTYSWFDNSYGIKWVGVHGMDNSICLVTRHNDLDMTRVSSFHKTLPKQKVMYALTEALMSEVEGLPYNDELRERSGQSMEKPFGVVSVAKMVDEESGQQASSVEYDEQKGIDFLVEKMNNNSASTFFETIQTAISTFQNLCLQELKAEEFWVTAWNGVGLIDHLHVNEIEEHLAVINISSGSGGLTNNEKY